MAWIKQVTYDESSGLLRHIFDQALGRSGPYLENSADHESASPNTASLHATIYGNHAGTLRSHTSAAGDVGHSGFS